mgnify:CR=1 FL=1
MVLSFSTSIINDMLLFSIALVAGLILLVLSSDKFIEHSALVAKKLNVNPMVIGITLVAFGTSAPEMVVSAIAALDNAPEIAIGNVLGSNIFNTYIVMGVSSFFGKLVIPTNINELFLPLMVAMTILFGIMSNNKKIMQIIVLAWLRFIFIMF